MKFKHFDKIDSYILSEQSQILETKIKDVLKVFDDELEPARKLNSWTKITNENIFKNQQSYEQMEKLFRYVSPLIPAIAAIALYYLKLY